MPEAASEADHQRWKIIAAQDFVAAHGVKTVFGFGAYYIQAVCQLGKELLILLDTKMCCN